MSSDKGQPQNVHFGCILFTFYYNFIPAAQSKWQEDWALS